MAFSRRSLSIFLAVAVGMGIIETAFATEPAASNPEWKPREFPLIAWGGPPKAFNNIENWKTVKECNFTMALADTAELAEHRMDVVLSDAPIPPTVPVKAYNHLLGTSTASIFAAPQLAARYRKNFPACLDGAPFLLPMHESSLRRPLEQWFESENIRPAVIGEFKDRALMTTFGQASPDTGWTSKCIWR